MTPPLPRCAYCGERFDERRKDKPYGGRVVHTYRDLPGRPGPWSLGWHGACWLREDGAVREAFRARLSAHGCDPSVSHVEEIAARGPGRVVSARRWPQDAGKTEESDAEDIEHLMYPDGADEQLARFREERRLSRELREP